MTTAVIFVVVGAFFGSLIGIIVGLMIGARRRDDYEPVEHEPPRVMTRIWDGNGNTKGGQQ